MSTWTLTMKEVLDLFSTEANDYLRNIVINTSNRYARELEGAGYYDGIDSKKRNFYARIRARMREDGINKVPILVRDYDSSKKYLANGHHRVMIAYQLGLKEMLCTNDGDDSGWSEKLSGTVI